MIIKKLYHIRCQLFHYRNKAIIFMTNQLVALVGLNSYMSTTIQENCLKRVRFHSKLIRTKPVFVLSNLCLPENFNAQWLLLSFQEDERKVDLHPTQIHPLYQVFLPLSPVLNHSDFVLQMAQESEELASPDTPQHFNWNKKKIHICINK